MKISNTTTTVINYWVFLCFFYYMLYKSYGYVPDINDDHDKILVEQENSDSY